MREPMCCVLFVQAVLSSLSLSFGPTVPTRARCRPGPAPWYPGSALRLAEKTRGFDISEISESLNGSFKECASNVARVSRILVKESRQRLGLFAAEPIAKGDVLLSIPFDDKFMFTARMARDNTLKDVLPESFEGWTGDAGLIALLVLNEVARAGGRGTPSPERSPGLQCLIGCWVRSLPSPNEFSHPFLWSEAAQEVLQASSTTKIYRKLDDIEEDATWMEKHIFEADRARFPSVIEWNGKTIDCFSVQGFKWAVALAQSRSFFIDGALRLIPILDMCNHDDDAEEIRTASMGVFGSSKGSQLVAPKDYAPGEEVFCSYGPMSPADFLLEYGFCPHKSWINAAAQLTFEIDPKDRFYDDKIDVLECEDMNPVQTFDVVTAPGREGEPDAAMLQFVRLSKLGSTDAFLLESIFRKDVWGLMRLPVSEQNELEAVNTILSACEAALNELGNCPDGGPEVCTRLRKSESFALTRTVEYLLRDREALDLKEYYQERRLKDLGLDSDWSLEDNLGSDSSYGESRTPGIVDYDW
jgi:[ribulose-bisphosphate carboxylase]/[fructose-bisphosphate aldolase]-lysine N-methyltransferase